MFNINLKDIREELENIKEISTIIDNFQQFSELHDKNFLKRIYQQDIPLKVALTSSHLKEKNEINERLRSLLYNLSVLRSSILTKDKEKTLKIINNFLKNDYSGISIITAELNDFKEKINNLEHYYGLLMNYVPKTLERKITIEDKYKEYVSKLHSMHKKQKEVFINITKLFLKLSKKSIKNVKI